MKPYLTLIVFVCFSCLLKAQNKTADQDAIRKVIELESLYYFQGNYDKWASTWAHEPTSYWIYAWPTWNTEMMGWDTISTAMKQDMKNGTPLSEQEVNTRFGKYNYQYKINGNLANVTYREGQGNLMTATLEKQNGEWKITGETHLNSSSYNVTKSTNFLKSLAGKWKYVEGSYKTEGAQPADSNFKQMSKDYDIRETPYGVELNSVSVYSYAGNTYSASADENFIADNDQKVIRYFDFEKGNNNVGAVTGTASSDSSGNFVVKGMYNDKPMQVMFENIYSFTPDGLLHHEGRSYDANGKLAGKWFFVLKRDYASVTK